MHQRISDKFVKSLEGPASGNKIYYDSELKGFGVRITAAGQRAFILNYRVGRRERRITIGQYPDWTVAAARARARELKREVSLGLDPMGERQADRTAPLVKDLVERYIESHLVRMRPGSQRNNRSLLERHILPRLGNLKVTDVRASDVDSLHRSLKNTPYLANRTVALLSRLFNLAIRWDMRDDNPARGVERYPEKMRTRYLNGPELVRLTKALENYPNQTVANAIRLLMLTGARKTEALTATWDQFDIETGLWIKPSSHTKQKREHRVPLNGAARALLTELKETATSDYVFPGRVADEPLKDIKKSWRYITKAAGLEDVRVHDLRHTYASILASAGQSLPIIGALLGHTQVVTTARYAHLLDDPLRKATERVGDVVDAAFNHPTGDVVRFVPKTDP